MNKIKAQDCIQWDTPTYYIPNNRNVLTLTVEFSKDRQDNSTRLRVSASGNTCAKDVFARNEICAVHGTKGPKDLRENNTNLQN